MPATLLRRASFLWLAVLACLTVPAAAGASKGCPFCSMQGQTLTGEVNQASMVIYGTLGKAEPSNTDFGEGTTPLEIETVIKGHDDLKKHEKVVGGKKVITLSRYVPVNDKKYKFLVFCDVFKGKIDPYRGVPVAADSDMPKYLKGALELKDEKEGTKRLRFFFEYLDNDDMEISNDAYKEFGNADDKDFRAMAAKLPADKIARWLQDPKTPGFRFGLYASMLGHCGKDKDAELLRTLLDDPLKRASSGVDGILAGYTMLRPKEGWEYTVNLLKDVKKDFLLRYAALRAARYFWDFRSNIIDKKDVVAGVKHLLDDPNMADLAIEDLRKWGRSELAIEILGLYNKPGYDIPIVRRAILRYALTFPQVAQANEFVTERRKQDPQGVSDVEELLKLEAVTPAAPPAETKTNKDGTTTNK